MSTAKLVFKADTASAQSSIKSLNSALGGLKSTAMGIGSTLKSAFLPLAAVGGLATAGILKASKSLIDFGGELQDLSDKTGITVENLVVMGEAFERAGLSMANVAPTLTKMVKALDDPSDDIVELFDDLGLSLSNIKDLSIEEQFKAITSAIGGMGSQSDKMAALLKLFGRSGVDLMPLVKDADAMKNAAKYSGDLARNMQTLAPVLEPLGDAIGGLKTKFLEFVSTFALAHTDEIERLTEFLNNVKIMDLVQDLKKGLEDGTIWKAVGAQMTMVIKNTMPYLKESFTVAMEAAVLAAKELWDGSNTDTKLAVGGVAGLWGLDKILNMIGKLKNLKSAAQVAEKSLTSSLPGSEMAKEIIKNAAKTPQGKALGWGAAKGLGWGAAGGLWGLIFGDMIGKQYGDKVTALPYAESNEAFNKRINKEMANEAQGKKYASYILGLKNVPSMIGSVISPITDKITDKISGIDLKAINDKLKWVKIPEFGNWVDITPKPKFVNALGYEAQRLDVQSLMAVGGAKGQMTDTTRLVSLHQKTNEIIAKMYSEMKKERKVTW